MATSASNHWEESIDLMISTRSLADENIPLVRKFRGWRERSATEGEKLLRRAAEDGDTYAMERLGLRLVDGDGLAKENEEGLSWLRKSAELGNAIAMERLSECLLDTNQTRGAPTEGEQWLRTAIAHHHHLAKIALATRLMTGTGIVSDPDQGRDLLIEAARQGSQLARIKLGVYLLAGWGVNQDREEGLRWLRRAGAIQPSQLSSLGFFIYLKSLAAPTRQAPTLAGEAGILFYEAVRQEYRAAELSLAYLLRRGEISRGSYPSLGALLSQHLYENNPHALANQALRLAKGIQCAIDWNTADTLIRKLPAADRVLLWWFARSEEGDAEGHLMVGWLCRHRLAADPERLELVHRIELARSGGWAVPDWMNSPTPNNRGS